MLSIILIPTFPSIYSLILLFSFTFITFFLWIFVFFQSLFLLKICYSFNFMYLYICVLCFLLHNFILNLFSWSIFYIDKNLITCRTTYQGGKNLINKYLSSSLNICKIIFVNGNKCKIFLSTLRYLYGSVFASTCMLFLPFMISHTPNNKN